MAVVREITEIQNDLQDAGLLLAAQQATLVLLLPLAVSMIAPILGAAKIEVGISRGRPVDFLVFACFASVFANMVIFLRRPALTRAGDAVLRDLRARNGFLRSIATTHEMPTPEEFALSTALFGVAILAPGPLAYAIPMLMPPGQSGGGWNSGGNCTGVSSCSGGGGGCSSGGSSCGGGGSSCGGCSSS
jgi:hypothetical protein